MSDLTKEANTAATAENKLDFTLLQDFLDLQNAGFIEDDKTSEGMKNEIQQVLSKIIPSSNFSKELYNDDLEYALDVLVKFEKLYSSGSLGWENDGLHPDTQGKIACNVITLLNEALSPEKLQKWSEQKALEVCDILTKLTVDGLYVNDVYTKIIDVFPQAANAERIHKLIDLVEDDCNGRVSLFELMLKRNTDLNLAQFTPPKPEIENGLSPDQS